MTTKADEAWLDTTLKDFAFGVRHNEIDGVVDGKPFEKAKQAILHHLDSAVVEELKKALDYSDDHLGISGMTMRAQYITERIKQLSSKKGDSNED